VITIGVCNVQTELSVCLHAGSLEEKVLSQAVQVAVGKAADTLGLPIVRIGRVHRAELLAMHLANK
jgi:hypothetical protein